MPEQWISKTMRKIPKECKVAFLSTLCVGLVAHMYKFTNHLPNFDSLMSHYYPRYNMIHQGRHLQSIPAALRGFTDMPWVIGLLSLIYLGITMALLVRILEIHNELCIVMSSALVVVSPSVISLWSFMYLADCFHFACLLAVFSVYISLQKKYGWIIGALCLTLSLGIYQGYLQTTIAVILLWTMKETFSNTCKLKEKSFWITIGKLLGMGAVAAILYKVSLALMIRMEQASLTGHQGMDSMHFPNLSEILYAWKRSMIDSAYYFLGPLSKPSAYGILNLIIFLCLGALLVVCVWKRRGEYKISNLLLCGICMILYPCISHLFYFVTEEVIFHSLMQFSLVLLYVFLFWLYEKTGETGKLVHWVSFASAFLMVFSLIVSANMGYRVQTMSYEKTYALMNRIVTRMETLPDYGSAEKFALVGYVPGTDKSWYGESPLLTGYTECYIITQQKHVVAMLDDYFDVELEGVSEETLQDLKEDDRVQQMPCWPAEGSVIQIDDTIICKVAEDEN